jgi:two-component system phosphate regulon sensor histidine kinase PhoR
MTTRRAAMARPWRAWWARSGARLLFGVAVFLLIALGAWWLLLIGQSIRAQHQLTVQLLDRDVYVAAIRLRTASPPPIGVLAGDPRLEVVRHGGTLRTPARWVGDGQPVDAAQPSQPDARLWLVQPTAAWNDGVDRLYERRRHMVYGEGALLISLLGAVVAMLYQLIRAEARFRSEMQEFLGRVTHEMKTPLAGIKAVLQTLQAGRIPPDQVPELVGMALREAEREESLVQNLLLAQRMRLPDQQLARDVLDLAELLRRFAARRRDTHGEAMAIGVEGALHLRGLGDATALCTVLDNLADNAAKYGARRLQLTVGVSRRGVEIAAADDGMGFDPQRREELFHAYARSAAPEVGQRGTGLGLSICRALMQRMGGGIEAHSDGAGQGATFTVWLPAA